MPTTSDATLIDLTQLAKQIPHGHLAIATALSLCLGVVAMLPSKEASAKREVQSLTLPEFNSGLLKTQFAEELEPLLQDAPDLSKKVIKVKSDKDFYYKILYVIIQTY